jgi:hypothetical protein
MPDQFDGCERFAVYADPANPPPESAITRSAG